MRYVWSAALLAALLASSCSQEEKWSRDDGGSPDIVDALDTLDSPDVPWDSPDDPGGPDGMDVPLDPSVDTGGPDGTDVITDTPLEPDVTATCTPSDLVSQVMCGIGLKCTFTSLDVSGYPITFCDAAGTRGWNESCNNVGMSDDCQAGYYCYEIRSDRRCRRFCDTDTTCQSPPGGSYAACERVPDVSGTDAVGVVLCTFHCDVLSTASGCASGQACKLAAESTKWYTDCAPAGTGTGCASGSYDDCPAGEGCMYDGYTYQCLRYCRYPSGSPSCTSPDTCMAVEYAPSWLGVCY